MCKTSMDPYNSPVSRPIPTCFTDEKTEAQRGDFTSLREIAEVQTQL